MFDPWEGMSKELRLMSVAYQNHLEARDDYHERFHNVLKEIIGDILRRDRNVEDHLKNAEKEM